MRWPSTRRRAVDAVDAAPVETPASTRCESLERALALERRARALERDAARDEAERAGAREARSRMELESARDDLDEARRRASALEACVLDVCRTATAFAVRCAEHGLVERDVARRGGE